MTIDRKIRKAADATTSMVERPSVGERIADVFIVLICALVAFCSFIPMWHVLMSSFSDGKLLLAHEGLVILPVGEWTLEGYKFLLSNDGIIRGYINSIFYTVSTTLLGFLIACVAGYCMYCTTKLSTFMRLFVLIPMMFSGGMVPSYMVIRSLGWVGTPLALIIPGCTNAIFMIMMMNAFKSVPREMYEAAYIDGAGHMRTLFKVALPQAMNLGSVIILNSVVIQWNSWLPASIYVPNNRKLWPLQLWIKQIVADNENFLQSANPDYTRYLLQFVVIVAATLPIIVALPFFQDKLEKGVISGGIKG